MKQGVLKQVEIVKNTTTTINIQLLQCSSSIRVDIREFVKSEAYKGPTKKGVRMSLEQFYEIAEAIREIKLALAKMGK